MAISDKNKVAIMKYPIGIQSFEQIVEGGYVYLDKTALVYDLVHEGRFTFWVVLVDSESHCLFLLSNATSMARKICLKDLPLIVWRRNGSNTQCFISHSEDRIL